MFLIFDTETTGLPKRWKAPVTEVNNWPRLVQLAWIVADEQGQEIAVANHIVRPEGFHIPPAATQVHRISHQKASQEGEALESILEKFVAAVENCSFLVGHNISFDEKIVGAELIRTQIPHPLWHRESICTKMESTDFCAIPGKYGFKWPTLSELHQSLFGKPFPEAHDALADVRATTKCFFALKEKGIV